MELTNVTPSMTAAHRAMSSEAFQRSAATLSRARVGVRESLQAITSPEILTVLDRLRAGATPSQDDLDAVWLWIVGDAESYVRQENISPGQRIDCLARITKVILQSSS